MLQGKRDVESVLTMGIVEDVSIIPQPAGNLGPVEGVLFSDYGTDLRTDQTVSGDPAGARLKPGSGHGYGFGIRVDSPLGPLRLAYAFNDKKHTRLHFGVYRRN
ncbi:putative bacterial surface antigen (D15) [Lupinus albus]|uniref:Putative bacterial surface antigen (D15) n=1 Tax=Lupinus albus TaxID=3870 RepID=A0A6A4NH61_LUPAL|nr:putative bacterial surface antigen (D15) [Lupinus albus]